jgi:hypothetical protein
MIEASPAAPFDAGHPALPPGPDIGRGSPRRSRRANAIIVAVSVLSALVIVGLVVALFSGAVFGADAAGGCGGG